MNRPEIILFEMKLNENVTNISNVKHAHNRLAQNMNRPNVKCALQAQRPHDQLARKLQQLLQDRPQSLSVNHDHVSKSSNCKSNQRNVATFSLTQNTYVRTPLYISVSIYIILSVFVLYWVFETHLKFWKC